MNRPFPRRLAACFGFAAVALGAFGAHALRLRLEALGTRELWEKAVLYHLVHAVVLLWHGGRAGLSAWLFVAGIALFSGSLYLYALVKVPWLMILTPAGGTCLLAGWLCLALRRE